jgi:hypothetical protein
MKSYILAAVMALGFFQASLLAQTSSSLFYDNPPHAGQVLDANPQFPDLTGAGREIDFDSLNMAFTGNWPSGQSFSISASETGDTLFVGEGGMMLVLNITDPYNPVQIAAIHARAIIDDSYYDAPTGRLFLAAYFSGIEVWDVGDFSNPTRISRIPCTSYPRGGVYARGNYVYIATVADGFWVADISDPANPVMVGHRPIPGSAFIWDSDYQGDYAYLAVSTAGMRVIDFSNPVNPVIAGSFTGMTSGLCVRDTLAYIASSSLGFRILNIKNPASITLKGSCTLGGNPSDVTLSGNYAFVANSTTDQGGVNVVDISNPSLPVLVTTYPGFQTFIAGTGDAIGATGGTEGCLVLDVSDPLQPVEAYAWPLAGFTYQLTVDGNYGYTGSNGFRVFDLGDVSNPVQVGYNSTDGSLVSIKDTVAVYILKSMTANNKVYTMDISEPTAPYKLGQYNAPAMTWDLALYGNYAFVGCWWDGVRIIDFSNPSAPVMKSHDFGWYNGAEPGVDFCYVQALDIYGNYLYIVDYGPFEAEDTKGLYIFDITDPENPVLISRFATMVSTAQDVRAWGDYVYVADGSGGMEVIDVSDPILPVTAGYCSLPDGATGVDISWPFVFVSDYILGGVQVVDVSVPVFPFVTAYYEPSGVFAEGVTVKDNFVFVGDGVCGFQVYDLLTATDVADALQVTKAFSVYPNPASRQITIETSTASTDDHISIINLDGQEIIRQQIIKPRTIIDISNLSAGIYFVQLTNEKIVETQKVMKW